MPGSQNPSPALIEINCHSGSRLQLALTAARMGVWCLDLATNRIDWSPEVYSIVGVDSFDGQLLTWQQMIHPEDREAVLANFADAVTRRQTFHNEFRIIRPDAAIRWIANLGQIETDAAGTPVAAFGTIQDITERKQLEADQHQRNEDLRRITEVLTTLLTDLPPERLAQSVFDHIAARLSCDIYTFFQLDGDNLQFVRSAGLDQPSSLNQQPIHTEAARRGSPIYLPACQTSNDPLAADLRPLGIRVYLGSPLLVNGRVIGAFALASRQRDHFTDWERKFLATITQAMTTALARSRETQEAKVREARLRNVIEHNPDGFWEVDNSGRLIAANDTYLQRSGYTRDELLQMHINDVEAQETWADTTAHIKRIRSQGHDRFESLHRAKDGTLWPVEVTATYVPPTNSTFAFLRDISERIRAENALRDSELRYRTLVDHAADGIFLEDDHGTFLDVNLHACESLGYTREELIGRNPLLFDSSISAEELQQVHEALARGEILSRDCIHQRKDGSTFLAEVRVRPFWTNGRQFNLAVVRDITERKRIESALRESESRLRVALRAAGAIAFDWHIPSDSVNRYFSNEPAFPRTSTDPERLNDVRAQIYPMDLPTFDARLAACLARGTDYYNSFRVVRPDGSLRWLEEWGTLERSADGRPERLTGVSIDITERKRTEQALVAFNRILEQIASGTDIQRILEAIARLIEQELPLSSCAILIREREATHLRLMASPNLHHDVRQAMSRVQIGSHHCTCSKAASLLETVITTDIATDPTWVGARDIVLAHGFRSCLSIPIFASNDRADATKDNLLGVFAILRSEIGHPDPRVLAILSGDVPGLPQALLALSTSEALLTPPPVEAFAGIAHLAGVAIEQHLAKTAHRESEKRFQAVLDFSPTLVYLKDLEGRYLFVNRRMSEVFGIPQDQWIGKTVHDMLPPDLATRFAALHTQVRDSLTPIQIEDFGLMINGRLTSFISVRFPLFRDDGEPYALCGISTDVTDSQRAQEERDRLWNLSPDALCIAGFDGYFKQVNPTWTRIFGWSADYFVSQPWLHFVHPDDLEATQLAGAQLFRGQPLHGFENRYRCQDGSYRWISWNCIPFSASQSIYGFARDVTEEKKLEAQFLQAQKMEAVGRLAGGVAHDFNNLLTVINGYSEMLLAQFPSRDPRRDSLVAIRDAGDRAASLTAQFLAFSRKAMVEPKILDLNQIVDSSTRLLRRLIGEDITLEVRLTPNLPAIKMDIGQLDQVLMNLVVNARDAMPRGGRLTISTATTTLGNDRLSDAEPLTPGLYVQLTIADTGCGMTPEVLAQLFEPFFTTKGVGKGTGLGLATVYGIVRQAGGSITAESEPGRGTTFRLLFPAVTEQSSTESTPAQASPQPGKETILLVEDENEVRLFTRMALENLGYHILEAASAVEALETLQRYPGPIQLLLTDVIMPEISGLELAQIVRANHPKIRILFMSGYLNDALLDHGLREGIDTVLQKPFSLPTLTCKVREVLDAPTPKPL